MRVFKRLIIFEEPHHAERVSRLKPSEEDCIVVFSVPAKVRLHNRGIRSFFADELIEAPDLNRMGQKNTVRAKKISTMIDNGLSLQFKFLRENNINIASAHFYHLKMFLDASLSIYLLLKALLNKVEAEEIIVFKDRYSFEGLAKCDDSMTPALVDHVFSKKPYRLRVIANEAPVLFNFDPASLRRLAGKLCRTLLFLIGRKRYRGKGLVLHNQHDVPFVVKEILKDIDFYTIALNRHFMILQSLYSFNFALKPVLPENKFYSAGIKEVFRELAHSREHKEIFAFDQDFSNFICKCLEGYFLQTVGRILPQAELIRQQLIRLSPKVLITSDCKVDMINTLLLEIARSMNVPIVSYQEGGGAGFLNWPMYSTEMDMSDYFLVYGNGARTTPFIKGRAEVVPVGSMRLGSLERNILRSKNEADRPIYVVLDASKIGSRQHYPYNGGLFSKAYANHLRIIDSLSAFKDTAFVIKTIAGREYLYEPFINKNHTRIVTRPLTEVLNDASAFLMEAPATALLEAILTEKPVAFFYDPECFNFGEDALMMMSKRIRIASDFNRLEELMSLLLEDIKSGSALSSSREFLNNYCLMKDTPDRLKSFFRRIGVSDRVKAYK